MPAAAPGYTVALTRLLIGLSQGVALYLLSRAAEAKAWPATDLRVYDALVDIARYVPIYAIVSVGNLRARTAAIWLAVLIVLCGGLGFYQGFRNPKPELYALFTSTSWLTYGFGLGTLLFIGHSLVAAGDHDRRRIALFPTYFDIAWRLATQFLLSSLFVLLLWGILFLGATLFEAIGIRFFMKTILKTWFWLPTTAMASSAALHLTDAHTALVRGARNLLLGLLSWLMPIMTVIVVGFVATLPFTGLEPLWKTRYATSSLLGAVTILVLLINSHFQDGRPETRNSRVLTLMRLPAALILSPLVVLAAYGLHLRVAQYGWTPSRVMVVALLILAGCYAVGYGIAAITSGAALTRLPATNITSALVAVATIVMLLTPIADPARIAVASQISRLVSGAVDPDKFDFNFLRFRSARFGTDALERLKSLKEGPNATRIAEKASRAATALSPYAAAIDQGAQGRATPETRLANITTVPTDAPALPADFMRQDWASSTDRGRLPACLTQAKVGVKCEAIVADFMSDGSPGILLNFGGTSAYLFTRDAESKWTLLGTLGNVFCPGVRDGLKTGKIVLAPPRLKQIEVNGVTLPLYMTCMTFRN